MNSKEKKKLKDALYAMLYDVYQKHSFKLLKTKGLFQNKEFTVHWGAPVAFSDSLHFQPRLSVNNKEVYGVLSKLFPEAKNLTIFKVQGVEVAKEVTEDLEINEDAVFYKVESIADFQRIVEDHMLFMRKVGFPFFDKLSSVEGVNNYINGRVLKGARKYFESDERQIELKKFFDKREVLSGVVSAYLIKSPEIEELLERYRILFAGNRYILEDVEKIIDYFQNKQEV